MLEGPSIDLYKTIIESCSNSNSNQSVRLIASGGVSSIEDVEDLASIGCEGVIIGKALYENKISLKELERFL
jgi:phosphoribosylformimino-5-aminoimidazole carboxamide ribotide isomerase